MSDEEDRNEVLKKQNERICKGCLALAKIFPYRSKLQGLEVFCELCVLLKNGFFFLVFSSGCSFTIFVPLKQRDSARLVLVL